MKAIASVVGCGLAICCLSSAAEEASKQQMTAEASNTDRTMDKAGQGRARVQDIEELIITGSRLRAAIHDTPTPVVILDRERISQLGASSVADALDYLPQQSFSNDDQFNAGGQRFVRMRGLGLGTTLVLINGRRTVTSALGAAANAFDLNAIPISAVERVEVLSDSASAVYGADAVGGVVNIILKDDVTNPTVDIQYGAASGGATERRASLTAGRAGARAHGLITLDYFERDFLIGQERDRYANKDFRRFGGSDFRVNTTNPGNVCTASGENLPGLSEPCAAVPNDSTGIDLTPADFIATAGLVNRDSLARFASVVPKTQQWSLAAVAEIPISAKAAAFAEALYSNNHTERLSSPLSVRNALVPAENPFNPFGVDVRVNYLLTGLGPTRELSDAESLRAVVGLRGELSDWDWEIAALGIDGRSQLEVRNRLLNAAALNASLRSADPSQALNVFQHGAGAPISLLQEFVTSFPPNKNKSKALQGSGLLRGSLATLPAGSLELVVGAESRSEEIDLRGGVGDSPLMADRDSNSIFSEMRIPLTSGASMTLASRLDDYSDFGRTFNPQYGLQWRVASLLLLRGSHGTSFRAPSLFELHGPTVEIPGNLTRDRRRNDELSSYTFRAGGNPNLDPERSESTTFGFVLTPDGGLQMAATLWAIKQHERVNILDPELLLANEELFPERITRATPTSEDVANGRPGALVSVDSTNVNFGRLKTQGVDLEIRERIPTSRGQFTPSLMASWVRRYELVDLPGAPALNRVNVADVEGTIPRWRATASLSWEHRGLGLTTTVRHTPEYEDATRFGVKNGRHVAALTLVDIQASFELNAFAPDRRDWLRGLTLRAGLINAFDEEPPFSEVGLSAGFDPSQADTRQRYAYVRLSKAL